MTTQPSEFDSKLYVKRTRSFRGSKAHVYRNMVQASCRRLKSQLLLPLARNDAFVCPSCLVQRPSRHARLAHLVPLKQLWTAFKAQCPVVPIICRSRAWQQFHSDHGAFAILCKDCETKPQEVFFDQRCVAPQAFKTVQDGDERGRVLVQASAGESTLLGGDVLNANPCSQWIQSAECKQRNTGW